MNSWPIESLDNAKFKAWKDLLKGSSLKKADDFLVPGEKIIAELLQNPLWKIKAVLLTKNHQEKFSLKTNKDTPYFVLSPNLFQELDILGTNYPLLVVEQKKLETWSETEETKGLEVVLPLGDPQNLGAAIRSAVAFGANRIILTADAANPYHPKAVKASSGALFNAKILKTEMLNQLNLEKDFFALDLAGTSLDQWRSPKNLRLLVGEEGKGVPESFKGQRIKIPMENTVESLNAQTSLAIVAYEVYRQNLK